MRHLLFFVILLTVVAAAAASVTAQSTPEPESVQRSEDNAADRRPDLFHSLGVTPEQRQQIRTLRRQGREEFSAAQKRFREANKALDAAIYSDVIDEQLIERLIIERNEAEAALSRLRTMSELSLRKILTPEQVVKFREIRSRFAKREAELRSKRARRTGSRSGEPIDTPDN